MDEYLERLMQMVPPPLHPLDAGDPAGFSQVEEELGLTLPAGYKQVIHRYGRGLWQGFWSIASPFTGDDAGVRRWHLPRYGMTAGPDYCTKLRQHRDEYPEFVPWPIYPESGGLFPWAMNDNGGTVYWLTEGAPDHWPTLYAPRGADTDYECERYDLQFSKLLFQTVAGESGLFRSELGPDFVYGQPNAFRRPLA